MLDSNRIATIKPQWVCLYFPQLPLEIFTRAGDCLPEQLQGCLQEPPRDSLLEPLRALVITEKQRVFCLNQRACELGIKVGHNMDTAYSLSDSVQTVERDPEKEQRHLISLAHTAYQFTSHVAISEPYALLLDVTASLKLFAGLEQLLILITETISDLGFNPIIRHSRTPQAALLLAKSARPTSPPQQYASFAKSIHQVPIGYMAADKKIIEGLGQMGIATMKDLLALPRSGLTRRFGQAFTDYLLRLIGKKADPYNFIQQTPVFDRDITFLADVNNLSALTFPINRLLAELSSYLTSRQLQLDHFTWGIAHRSHETHHFSIYLAQPENDSKVFLALTQLRFDQITDIKEVDNLSLSARQFHPAQAASKDLFGDQHNDRSQSENHHQLLNIFRARLGPNTCFGLAEANDHRPEKAWQRVNLRQNNTTTKKPAIEQETPTNNPRPAFLLAKPMPLKSHLGSPILAGKLTLLKGPERIDYGWWDQPLDSSGQLFNINLCRDYYIARNQQGCLYWVFIHSGQDRWFLHGIFS